VITLLPQNHRNNKRHRMFLPFSHRQKLLHIYGRTCAEPWNCLGRRSGIPNPNDTPFPLSRWWPFLPCKRHFTANATKAICTVNTVTRHH
jgi:hypothetical protein